MFEARPIERLLWSQARPLVCATKAGVQQKAEVRGKLRRFLNTRQNAATNGIAKTYCESRLICLVEGGRVAGAR